jgi:site-specific DNA recombinase
MRPKAVGYVRRSARSDERTASLEAQRAAIEEYCEALGFELAEVVEDDGVSGGNRSRFAGIRRAANAHAASSVVIYHPDRLARDAAGYLDEIRALDRRGIEVHAPGRGRIEVRTSMGILSNGVEALVAEHYRVLVGEKTRDALALRRRQGRRYSNIAPYGFQATEAGLLEEVEAEQATIRAALALRAEGLSLRATAASLADRGMLARGGLPFKASTLRGILARVHDRSISYTREAA